VSRARNLISIYAGIGRTYWAWAPSLLLLAVVIFIPLGLLDALAAEVEVDSLNITNGLKLLAVIAAVGAVTTTSLLGEVFFSGAVAVSLTHPEHLNPPSLRTIARTLRYGRLIAVDLVYVVIVAVGLLLFVVPGVLAFVWFGLAGPVVEIEHRTVWGALRRSWTLVRGRFWTVFGVLVPIEIVGDSIGGGIAGLVHGALGHGLLASWLAESLSNIAFSPIFAVAAVLLTLELIEARDGSAPALHSAPVPA
jgi:hypothetical protein